MNDKHLHTSETLHADAPVAASPQGLADRKELAATAFERTRMPMVVTDPRQPDNPIVLANDAFLQLTGYGADQVVGRNCRFLQGQGSSPAAIAALRAAVREEREGYVEILNYRKDGTPFWVLVHLSPVHDDKGRLLYFFGSHIDLTMQRQMETIEASEHLLRAEVNHRTRNVLAVVLSIVKMSRADDAHQYAAAVQNRVLALAQAHTLLSEGRWTAVQLEELIRRQLAPFGLAKVELSGPELLVPPGAVQPLALIFHELAVNAATHGALSQAAGKVKIDWAAQGEGGVALIWEEAGGNAPAVPRRPGFGTTIVKGMIKHELKGTLESSWRTDGVKLAMHIPALTDTSASQGERASAQ